MNNNTVRINKYCPCPINLIKMIGFSSILGASRAERQEYPIFENNIHLNKRQLISWETIVQCKKSVAFYTKEILNSPWNTWFKIALLNGAFMTLLSIVAIILAKKDPLENPCGLVLVKDLSTELVLPRPEFVFSFGAYLLVGIVITMQLSFIAALMTPYFLTFFIGTIFYLALAKKVFSPNTDELALSQSIFANNINKGLIVILGVLYVIGQIDLVDNIMTMDVPFNEKFLQLFYHLYDAGMKFLFYYVIGSLITGNVETKRELRVLWDVLLGFFGFSKKELQEEALNDSEELFVFVKSSFMEIESHLKAIEFKRRMLIDILNFVKNDENLSKILESKNDVNFRYESIINLLNDGKYIEAEAEMRKYAFYSDLEKTMPEIGEGDQGSDADDSIEDGEYQSFSDDSDDEESIKEIQ